MTEDPKSSKLIRPFLTGKDVKRYELPESSQYLIFIPNGWTRHNFEIDVDVWNKIKNDYPAIANYLSSFSESAEKRSDKGEFWWELRACDYYDEFEKQRYSGRRSPKAHDLHLTQLIFMLIIKHILFQMRIFIFLGC